MTEIAITLDGAKASFRTVADLASWIETESQAWAWIQSPPTPNQDAQRVWNQFEKFYARLRNAIQSYGQSKDADALQNEVSSSFKSFVDSRKVPTSQNLHGSRVLGILQRNGGARDPETYAQALQVLKFFAGVDDAALPVSRDILRYLIPALFAYEYETGGRIAADNAVKGAVQLAAQQTQDLGARAASIQEGAETFIAERKGELERLAREAEEKVKAAIENIEAVQTLFKQQLGLQAPAQYWTDKAENHRKSANRYRLVLMWFGVVALLLLVAAYGGVFYAVALSKLIIANELSATFLTFSGLAIVTTAVLWAARILSRLFLSEHHLSIDASERATMATTFLALLNESAVEERDRAIVLAALFRPTADGIVKDEAPPVLTPGALLATLVQGKTN